MERKVDFPVFDADNHFYETQDAFTRYLPKQYAGAIEYVQVRGRTKIAINGQISDYIPNPTFDVVARPGAQQEYFRVGNPEGKSYRELIGEPMRAIPAFREPGPRLELMNELGVDRALMFPTLASLLEERMRDDVELTHAAVHSLNQWIHEEWSFNYQERIFAVPVVTLPIVSKAIEELEWLVDRGARSILIRPAPVPGLAGSRSFGLPEFDPFWQAVVDSDVFVTMHSSDSGYTRYAGDWTGPGEMLPFKLNAFRMVAVHFRPVEDALTALACDNLLARFPALKIGIIEAGADWLPGVLHRLSDTYKKMPQLFDMDPVEAIRRQIYISPFHEDNLAETIRLMGADHLLFGSDYPHPEGLAEPTSYLEDLPADMTEADKAKIMGGNLGQLMKVSDAVSA